MQATRLYILLSCLMFAVSLDARAQTRPAGVIDVPPTVIGESESIGSDTTLNVNDGGTVGRDFEAGLPNGSNTNVQVNINGGEVGNSFNANAGSTVNIRGGNVGNIFDANAGSVVNMSGGNVGQFFARTGSVVNVSGGDLANGFRGLEGSSARFSGGTSGQFFGTFPGSLTEFVGGEFRFNGSPVTDSSISLEFQGNNVFTGTFADGSPFIFSGLSSDRLAEVTLTRIELPTLDTTPIVVDTQNPIAPNGIRAGQTLTLRDTGELRNNFAAVNAILAIEDGVVGSGLKVAQSTVDISGGSVGPEFTALADSVVTLTGGNVGDDFSASGGSVVNLNGGLVGDEFRVTVGSNVNIVSGVVGEHFRISEGGTANISGGEIGAEAVVSSGSTLNVSGGEIANFFSIFNSTANITGGTIGDWFRAEGGSEVNISGGVVGELFSASGGSTVNLSGGSVGNRFFADFGSALNIRGREFVLDGEPLDLVMHSPLEITMRDVQLSGRLSDGTAFEFDLISITNRNPEQDIFSHGATLTVTLTPLLLGDCNLDGFVNFLDIGPFISILAAADYLVEADIDQNEVVDFLDIQHFIAILSGQ